MILLDAFEVKGMNYLQFIDECWGCDMTYQDYVTNAQLHNQQCVSELEFKRRYATNDAHLLAVRMQSEYNKDSYAERRYFASL